MLRTKGCAIIKRQKSQFVDGISHERICGFAKAIWPLFKLRPSETGTYKLSVMLGNVKIYTNRWALAGCMSYG